MKGHERKVEKPRKEHECFFVVVLFWVLFVVDAFVFVIVVVFVDFLVDACV